MGSQQAGGSGAPGDDHSLTGDPARWLRRRIRGGLFRLASRWLPAPEPLPLPDLAGLERVLLVHVSQRIGNTILVTPGLDALLERMRNARVVFVGGAQARAVLEGYDLERIEVWSRSDTMRPWRFLRLLRRLRAERFDAAIHLGTSTRSIGPLIVGFSGATHRIGRQRERGGIFFTTPLARPAARHKVDAALETLGSLGVPATGERRMLLRADETAAAEAHLRGGIGADFERPVGLFVGGRARKGKDWSLSSFSAVAKGVRARGIPLVVLLGPEERARAEQIRRAIGEAVYVEGEGLRVTAAIVACCGAVLSPDAGPMHLSIAAGAPTAAVFRKSNFDRWGPRLPHGEVIYDPEGTGARSALETLLRLYDEPRRGEPAIGEATPALRMSAVEAAPSD
jgi:heptosyltransferase I